MDASDAKVPPPACSRPDQGTSGLYLAPTATIDILPELDIDATDVAAQMPTTCSTGGLDNCTDGDNPVALSLIPGSALASFSAPPEDSTTPPIEPSVVFKYVRVPLTTCSTDCSGSDIGAPSPTTQTMPSRLLQAAAPALTHELMVLRPMPWPSFECSQVWTSLVNYGIPVSFQDVLQITPAMGDVELRLSGLPPRRQYLLQIASMSRNAEVQSTTKHLKQPVHLLPHDTYVMKHFSSARNSLREALRYLQSVQLKLPWPSFSNTCRAVQVHWKFSEHQVQEHAAVCSIPTPDHQPRMKSKLQEMLHPAPLQIFLISSVEQQPWPSGHFTFLISTKLSDCCSEMIHPCVDAGAKRMELSTQSAFFGSSEQFLLEIAWPLSFERNTTTGRPYCMHNSRPPFGEIRPWFSIRIWGWALHLLGSVKTSSVTQHVTCNMVCLQLQRFGLLAIHLIDGISLSSYQYTATGDTWMEVLLQPMEGAEYFVHHGASCDFYSEKFTLERKLEIKLFQLVRVHCKDRWSLWADREILEFNHAISRIHRTSIIGSLLHREFCQRTCIGMATKFSGSYNVQPAAAAMKLHMPSTEALVNCGCRHLISIEAYHQLWDYSEVGSSTTYLKLNEVCTVVVCMFEQGTSQDWELRLYFHQHAPLVYSRRVDSSPVSPYIGTQKTYVLLHEDCPAAYASAGELQMIIPDATVRLQSVASLSQLSIKLAYPNCESEYMTRSLSQFRFCPFEYLETLHNPVLGTTKMLVPVHASLNSVVFLGMYCSAVRHESSTSNSASFSLKGSHYYLCPGGDMLGGSIISAIIASVLLARKGFDRDAHFLFLGSSCSDSIMLIFEKFAWQIAWSPPSRGFDGNMP